VTVVVDASVVIAATEPGDGHHGRAAQILRQGHPGSLTMHPVTLAEVLVGAVRVGRGQPYLEALLATGLTVQSGDIVAPLRLAAARAESGLKMPDAVVLATAQVLGADLASFDNTLAARARLAGLSVLD